MKLDTKRIDDAVLALLYLGRHAGHRTWKGHDWGALDRLYERNLITDPATKARSVVFTDEGLQEAERLCRELFATNN